MTSTQLYYFLFSGLVTYAGFALYLRNLRKFRDMHVSVISWLVWLFAEITNFVTCVLDVGFHEWPRLIFPALNALATGAIVLTAIRRKMYDSLTSVDAIILILVMVGFGYLLYTGDTEHTSLFVLLAISMGYFVTAWGILKGELHERPIPWLIVCGGATLALVGYSENEVHGVVRHFSAVAVCGEGGVFLSIIIKSAFRNRR